MTVKNIKKAVLSLLSATVVSCGSTKTEFSATALSTSLLTTENNEITFEQILKKHEGKTILIEAWASWCGDCVKNMPNLKKLQANNPTVDFVFLSADKNAEAWKTGIAKHQITGDHYLIKDGMKGVFGNAIDLDWIPRYIIIDKTGKIVTYRAIETDFEKVNETLLKI